MELFIFSLIMLALWIFCAGLTITIKEKWSAGDVMLGELLSMFLGAAIVGGIWMAWFVK